MNAAELQVAALEQEGVDHVFVLLGEEMEDLLFALRDSEVTFVPVDHEQGAAFMADVHGRLTGQAGVYLSTLGPGATNLLTGVADTHLDKSPLVAITAQGGLERLHQESHQAINVVGMFEPVTKWNTQLGNPGIIHESVRKAFKLAEYEKPGATHLELPENVAKQRTDTDRSRTARQASSLRRTPRHWGGRQPCSPSRVAPSSSPATVPSGPTLQAKCGTSSPPQISPSSRRTWAKEQCWTPTSGP